MNLFENKTILVTGAAGLCGTAVVKKLLEFNNCNIVGTVYNRRSLNIDWKNNQKIKISKLDLMDYNNCKQLVENVDIVIHCAAFSGGAGLQDNHQIDLFRNNIIMTSNLVAAAVEEKVELFGYIGSSTMYPQVTHSVKETEGFDGDPFEFYMGVGWLKRYMEKVLQHFQSITETNFAIVRPMAVFGENDNFNERGHVIPQLIMKAGEGMNPFQVWGDGNQIRDFLYVEDLVDGLFFIMANDATANAYNVSSGQSINVKELANIITEIYGYRPEFEFDISKPTAIPVRQIDISKIENLGWKPKYTLRQGLEKTIGWYKRNK